MTQKKFIRIGGACIWLDNQYVRHPEQNMRQTTVKNLSGLTELQRHAWLLDLVQHNLEALKNQLRALAAWPPVLRMWRISSELLPVATHPVTAKFYANPAIDLLIQTELAWCGAFARQNGIRLSFHPAQFVVLGSQNPGVRQNAMRELRYHCDVFTRMGYNGWHDHGTSVNVHVGPKLAAVSEMRDDIKRAPQNVRDFLTLENDEFSWSVDDICTKFGDLVPVVLDIHHYWIMHGRRLDPNDGTTMRVWSTWKGARPKIHHALSARAMCTGVSLDKPFSLAKRMEAGWNKSKLRAHSDHPWHRWSNEYAASFGWDVMWEGKDKNRGALQIARQLGLVKRKK